MNMSNMPYAYCVGFDMSCFGFVAVSVDDFILAVILNNIVWLGAFSKPWVMFLELLWER